MLNRLKEAQIQLNSDSIESRLAATKQIRQLLSVENNPPIDEVITSGVVPILITFLMNNSNSELQFEAAWSLTNIASGTSKQTQLIIHLGAIPAFVFLLSSPTLQVRDQSIWALGNIAGDSPECRDFVLNANALPLILEQILNPDTPNTMRKNATWTLSNLCRGKPQPNFDVIKQSIPVLAELIKLDDKEILTDACWALSYLSDGTNEMIQAVMSSGVTPRLVELLNHTCPTVITPALRSVGNFVTGDDSQTQTVLDCNILVYLKNLLSHTKTTIIKETCWTLSNIAAGNPNQVELLYTYNIMPNIIQLLNAAYDIKREAAWVIANATCSAKIDQITTLVNYNVIPSLYALLSIPDVEIKDVTLTALTNILRAGNELQKRDCSDFNPYSKMIMEIDGGDSLANLQDHPHQKIQKKVQRMLKEFFPLENDEDETVAPTINEDQTAHSFGLQNVVGQNLFQSFN